VYGGGQLVVLDLPLLEALRLVDAEDGMTMMMVMMEY